MHGIELILILLTVVTLLAAIAERTTIPYSIFLVLGGLALGLILGGPAVELDPDLVFLLFLPPILFSAAYVTSWRDFRANLRPIGLLAVGCVLFTTLAVAVVAHTVIPDLSWPAAFVLGAAEDHDRAEIVLRLNPVVNSILSAAGHERQPLRWHFFSTYLEHIGRLEPAAPAGQNTATAQGNG